MIKKLKTLWFRIAPDVTKGSFVSRNVVMECVGDLAFTNIPDWRNLTKKEQKELLKEAFPKKWYE